MATQSNNSKLSDEDVAPQGSLRKAANIAACTEGGSFQHVKLPLPFSEFIRYLPCPSQLVLKALAVCLSARQMHMAGTEQPRHVLHVLQASKLRLLLQPVLDLCLW